jgi:hypothetical protein
MERDLADELMEIHSLHDPEDPHPDRELIRYLACQTRQAHEEAETEPIRRDNWRKLAEQHRDTPLDEKLDRLLCLLADRAGLYGVRSEFEDADRMLVDEPVYPAFLALLDDLKKDRLITVVFEAHPKYPDEIPREAVEYTVTVLGWKKCLPSDQPAVPGRPGPRPIADRDYQNLLEALREDGQSDEWADEGNLKKVCLQLDKKKVPVPRKWKSGLRPPGSWKDRNHGAKTWNEALKHGGRTPVVKVLRSRQQEARTRANSPR